MLDLGAWVGPITLLAAARGASVLAVEADPAALGQLRRNLAANPGLAPRVTVVPRAVAPEPGPVTLGARRKPGDSMSSVLLGGADLTWETEAITPAELAAALPPAGDLFVKLDIEGGEYGLLPAFGPLLSRDPRILVSFHPAILQESGEEDVATRTVAALALFTGWHAWEIGPAGAIFRGRLPDIAIGAPDAETWLLTSGPRLGRDLPPG